MMRKTDYNSQSTNSGNNGAARHAASLNRVAGGN